MYEQSISETGGKKGGMTFKDAAKITASKIDAANAEKHREESARENRRKYGSGKYREVGVDDRMNGRIYDDSGYDSQDDRQSYYYGYYEAGNMALSILVNIGKYDGNKTKIFPKGQEELEERIKLIAENDGMNPEINFEKLPQAVRESKTYSNYYVKAYIRKNRAR